MESDLLRRIFTLADKYNKKVYAVVSNMSIASERRDLMKQTDCVVCNLQEAEILFSSDYSNHSVEELAEIISKSAKKAHYPKVVVTMGENGAVYCDENGYGICPAQKTAVVDTTGAGDAFFAGVAIGLTYHKTLAESCQIGTKLASSVIATKEAVCPRFQPGEFNIEIND